MTITETRPQNNTASMDSVGGIAAAQTPPKERDRFADALYIWLSRLSTLNNAPLNQTVEEDNELSDLLIAAEEKLFSEPVKDISDLRALVEVIWQDPHSLPGPETLAVMFAAIRKLDKGNASRTFDPANWLHYYQKRGGGWHESEGQITLMSPATETETLQDLMWELETRDGLEAVKAEIRTHSKSREDQVTTWASVFSAYQTAKAKLDEHEATVCNAPAGSIENIADEHKTARLSDEHTAAVQALFDCPSPNGEAFKTKVRAFTEYEAYCWNDAPRFAQIIADEAQRFAG